MKYRKGQKVMKYRKGQKVKINTDSDISSSWAVISAMKSYPDAIFTIEDFAIKSEYENREVFKIARNFVYYTIVTDPKTFFAAETYRYDIREDYLISVEEIRDKRIDKILTI